MKNVQLLKQIMSTIKQPLLITGGCSLGDPKEPDYKNSIIVWPIVISKILNIKLLNVAKQGASNDYIENIIFDSILQNYKKYDIQVMVLWTGSDRVNVFDTNTYPENHQNYDQKKILNKTFRNIKSLDFICRQFNIPCYHRIGIGFENSDELNKWLTEHPMLKEFNLSLFEIISGRWSSAGEGAHAQWVLENGHPNQDGQNAIAQMFIDTMNNIPLGTLDTQSKSIEDNFIYD